MPFCNLFEITLTLPGIAGVILGIGMAVDANVIIISRIREEIAAGKSVLTSIKTGYKKGKDKANPAMLHEINGLMFSCTAV